MPSKKIESKKSKYSSALTLTQHHAAYFLYVFNGVEFSIDNYYGFFYGLWVRWVWWELKSINGGTNK